MLYVLYYFQAGVPDELDEIIGQSDVECPLYEPFNETLDNTSISNDNK